MLECTDRSWFAYLGRWSGIEMLPQGLMDILAGARKSVSPPEAGAGTNPRNLVQRRACSCLYWSTTWAIHEKADFARVSETLVTAKRVDQAHQDRWTSGAVCREVGVSACSGSCAQGSVPASAGAYRRAPSSTRVANVLEIIRGGRGNQGRGACLKEFEGSAIVLIATSAAH